METQKSALDAPYQMNETKLQEMTAFLEIMEDRIEVLEYLKDNAYFFPDWLVKIQEGIQALIDYKHDKQIPCDEEKEVLVNVGYFFAKMAFFSGLISDWHREIVLEKETAELKND